jgi:hypothetical protein
MPGTPNPVDLIGGLSSGADTGDVSKTDFITWAKQRVRCAVGSASSINNIDFTGQTGNVYVASLKGEYYLDSTDTTSVDDGFNVIVDSAGNRFKPVGRALSVAGANALQVNGSMSVSQENGTTQVTLSNHSLKYIVDCFYGWYGHNAGTAVLKGQQVTPPGSPSFGSALQNCLQLTSTTALSSPASGDWAFIETRIEGYRTSHLGWGAAGAQPITVGFWVYATIAGTMTLIAKNSATNRAYPINIAINNPTTWEYKTVTIPGDVTGTWLKTSGIGLQLSFCFACGSAVVGTNATWQASNPLGTASTTNFFASNNNTICLTGVSVLAGNVPLTAGDSALVMRPYDEELRRAKRYWQKSYDYATAPGTASVLSGLATSIAYAVSNCALHENFEVEMCIVPTVNFYSFSGTSGNLSGPGNVNFATTALYPSTKRIPITSSSGMTIGQMYYGHWTADARL